MTFAFRHVQDEGEAKRETRDKWYNVAMLTKYVLFTLCLIQYNTVQYLHIAHA